MTMNDHEVFSITQAASFVDRTRQAIVVAMNKGQLKSFSVERRTASTKCRWYIYKKDLIHYIDTRYSRLKCKDIHGKPIYSPENGIYSPTMLADHLGIKVQRVYYLMRSGHIPYKIKNVEREFGISKCRIIQFQDIKNLEFIKTVEERKKK